ncbi:MAG: GGDEF domain-containing protein [Lachnospiraceae bacterium]|nr:GGDEF domain-containing protein [Lachnospiraceae bacterium]
MQKIFIRYTFAILTAAILLIFFINFLFTFHSLESQQFKTFQTKTDQIVHTLEMNQEELAIIRENLDEDYLTRAKAAAYVLDREDELSLDVEEMKYLANLLNVDEVHVIDENGIIVAGSVSQYIGIDMADHKQTRAFLALLESDDENAYLIQDSQPNAAENKVMQYVGVARKVKKGIVQVGFKPTRQMEAEARNTYDSIFTLFPADVGEEFFIIDSRTGTILGHSNGLNQPFDAECYQLEQLTGCTEGAYRKGVNGRIMYITATAYEDKLICAALPRDILFEKLWTQIFTTFLYLLLIEGVVLLLLNHLVKRKAVDGIHQIMENLTAIANGHLDTAVNVGGNREFEALSSGINTMVKSIVSSTDRISAIIEISGIPLAAFEYERGLNHVFNTSGLKELLDIPDQMAQRFFSNSVLFDRYIREIMTDPIAGETDIFHIRESKYVRIHISESSGKYLGVVMDVSSDIQKKQQMHYENTHDSLTGLCKFPYFKQLASKTLQGMPADQICAVVMMDLDYFKSINDTYGHDVGDVYLQSFSSVMQSMPREHFLTARRSGDEFCMMIFGCSSREEIIHYLDKFYDALKNHPVSLGPDQSKIISASSGFAQTANPLSNIHKLLSQADEALYDVKRKTKGCYGEYHKSFL